MSYRKRDPKKDMPVISTGYLRLPDYQVIAVDSEEFRSWVTSGAKKFTYDGNVAAFVARNECRNGQSGYWYAYRKEDGKTVKRYIGRSESITSRRLFEIGWSFTYNEPAPPPVQ